MFYSFHFINLMFLQNLFTILIIFIFFPFHTILCCQYSKTSLSKTEKVITSASVNSPKPITEKGFSGHPKMDAFYKQSEDIRPICKFGIHKQGGMLRLYHCDCKNVFGDGTFCEITLNRTSHYNYLLCLIDKSEAWKKNLEIQFSRRSINIIEEGEKFVKGSIENHISFKVFYFCERHAKNIFLWPQQSNYSSKNNSSYFGNRNVTNVPNILNETRTVKVSDIPTKCKFGMHKQGGLIHYCDCTNVFGDGTYCELNLNRSSHYKCLLCLIHKSEAWKKNLEDQFPKESIHFTEETPQFIKGFIGNHISFEVYYFCARFSKHIFLWP